MLNAGYSSNNVFLGRSDSAITPVFNTTLTYTSKWGFFLSGQLDYIPSQVTNKIDGASLEAGYNFEHNNLHLGAALTKFINSRNSTLVTAGLKATAEAEVSYNIGDLITPSLHSTFALNKSGGGNDIILTPGLVHEFYFSHLFSEEDDLEINPGIFLNAGTQNFYSFYYIKKKKNTVRTKTYKKSTAATTKSKKVLKTVSTNKLVMLDYEFLLPINYSIGKFGLELTPSYARAVNKSISVESQTTPVNATSVFYVNAAVAFTF